MSAPECRFKFPGLGIDGEVTVKKDEHTGDITVTVKPTFFAKDDRPTICYFESLDSTGKVLQRSVDQLYGSTGKRKVTDRSNPVRPTFDSADADEAEEEED